MFYRQNERGDHARVSDRSEEVRRMDRCPPGREFLLPRLAGGDQGGQRRDNPWGSGKKLIDCRARQPILYCDEEIE